MVGGTHLKYRETDLQKAVASYLNGLENAGLLAWNHPPNEGKRSFQAAAILRACGMKVGQPDCEIFPRDPAVRPFFVELKTLTGKIHKTQMDRQNLLSRIGYRCFTILAETPNEAVRKLERILREEGLKV